MQEFDFESLTLNIVIFLAIISDLDFDIQGLFS